MALHDVDKFSDNRGNPSLNARDILPPASVKAHATEGISYRTPDSAATAPKVITKDDQFVLFDGTANKILIGRDGTGKWDVKIAEDGVDVLTATDAQLLFSGSRNTLQVHGGIFHANIAAVNRTPGSYDDTVNVDISSLGLTETPMILAFYKRGSGQANLGDNPWGGTAIDFIDASAPANLRAFTIYMTNHSATQAQFTRRFINCSNGETLSAQEHNIAFIVCTQRAN